MLDRKVECFRPVFSLKELGYSHALPIDGEQKPFSKPGLVVNY